MNRRRLVVALTTALVAAAGGAGILLVRRDDAGPPAPPPGRTGTLAGYTVVYRVEVRVERTERSRRVVAVRRPFEGADRTTPTDPPGPETGLVARPGHLYRIDPDRVADLGDPGPAPAPGDLRIGGQLPSLERLGLVQRRGSATVAGRRCRVWRFGAPVTDPFRAPGEREYADACFDADGLLLAEDWYLDGRLLRRTRAEEVVPGPPGDTAFGFDNRAVTDLGAVATTPLPTDQLPTTGRSYWTAEPPPAGFELAGRYRARGGSGAAPLAAGEVTADVYVAGADAVWVEHRRDGDVEPPGGAGESVDAGALGRGWLWLTPQGPQIRVATGDGVVVVRGTIAPDRLLAFARSVRAHEGAR